MVVLKVVATDAALETIERLKAKHGPLMFYQSGGCCDGSAPMCFQLGEFLVGDGDLLIGDVGGCPYYIDADQYGYWKHTQLIVDVSPGSTGSFSLEDSVGVHFLLRGRVFTSPELDELDRATG